MQRHAGGKLVLTRGELRRYTERAMPTWIDAMLATGGSRAACCSARRGVRTPSPFAGNPKGSARRDLILRPVAPDRPPVTILRGDKSYNDIIDVAPDSKSVYFASEIPTGAIVYTVDFFPNVKW